MNHIELGKYGEDLAVNYLEKEKYKVLTRNYVWRKSEVDIVCEKNGNLIVVEVKTRNTSVYGEPFEAVTRNKQRQIVKVANQYIIENDINLDVQFDVISIVTNTHRTNINHIQDAFYPTI